MIVELPSQPVCLFRTSTRSLLNEQLIVTWVDVFAVQQLQISHALQFWRKWLLLLKSSESIFLAVIMLILVWRKSDSMMPTLHGAIDVTKPFL
jgi:hypothetical protein